MAEGRSIPQRKDTEGGVVFGSYVYEAPLLPYEKQLIAAIGSSEEEYRQFVGEVIRRSRVRPAGYEHIPDIRCDPSAGVLTSLLISLAVGLVSTGISMLLAPKPKALGGQDEATQRQLDSIRGGNRFTPSSGFDTVAELADYNSVIPVVFGLYNDVENVGGLLITPRLVWSRMLSYGRQQSAKLMFVVGEQGKADNVGPDGVAPPSLNGIFIGNNALDAIYSNNFAFYWKRNTTASGFKRIQNVNRIYGTGGSIESADPNSGKNAANDDVFLCQTRSGDFIQGFCHSFTPTNNTQFGVHSPIANGNAYRVNWRNVSILSRSGPDDPDGRLTAERKKICGNDDMDGTGRNYSRRMGIVKHNGNETSEEIFEVVNVQVGDTIDFRISDTRLEKNYLDEKVPVDDINSEVESQQIAADDSMQIGELFSIGSTVWQVTQREIAQYRPGEGDQLIVLKCVDTDDADQPVIGIVNPQKVVHPEFEINDSEEGQFTVGEGFFPLTKIARGSVRNSRPCDVTEIGVKSVVFQRLNGICNFMSLPTPSQLDDFDQDQVQLASGTISTHVNRSSAFTIYVRRAGLDESGNEFSYERIPRDFVVTGNKPVAQYNFIRIHHPVDKPQNEYEFKFVPRSGADLRSRSDVAKLLQLKAASSSLTPNFSETYDVGSYGTFKIATTGRLVERVEIRTNKEFFNDVKVEQGPTVQFGFPSAIGIDTYLPDDQPEESTFLTAVDDQERRDGNYGKLVSDPSNASTGRMGAFGYEAFGDPDADGTPTGGRKTFRTKEFVTGNRWVELEFDAEKFELPEDHFARVASGQKHTWRIADYGAGLNIRVVKSSPGWDSLSRFTIKRGNGSTAVNPPGTQDYQSSNPFSAGGLKMSGWELTATGVDTTALGVKGRSQGYFEELFGRAEDQNVGTQQSRKINANDDDGKQIEITLRSEVVEASDHWSGRERLWSHPTIEVTNDAATSKEWRVGQTFEHDKLVDEENIFASQYYTGDNDGTVGIRFVIEAVAEEYISSQAFEATRSFLNQSQYSDISLYGDLVQKSNESDPEHSIVYVNEMLDNDPIPMYENLTTAGLVLRASNSFARLDQLRVWLGRGVQVRRLHPDLTTYNDSINTTAEGPSNLFTDLVFYLLTNFTAGAGSLLKMSAVNANLVNVTDFEKTSRFLRANKLFCNGALTQKVNIREFISTNAPNFLCNFAISDGKFSLIPVVPTEINGEISTNPVEVKQIFTQGNILQDSFELEYLGAEERRDFRAVVRYRYERQNKLPQEKTLSVRLASSGEDIALESFDLTQFCTSRSHAFMVARYFLALRKLVTHTITFSTTIDGLDLAPGNFIKVITESSPYTSASVGYVSGTGVVTSATEIQDGTYAVSYYSSSSEDVLNGELQISGGVVTDSTFFNTIFSIVNRSTSENIYLVEQLTFEEDMTIRVVASEYPCDSAQVSELAKMIINDAAFTAQGPA